MTPRFLLVSTAEAPKCGLHATGAITYRVLIDESRTKVFLAMIANQGGSGYFSTKPIDFDAIHACVAETQPGQVLMAKQFKPAAFTVSRSANGPGFLAAICRSLGLLGPAEGKPDRHVVTGNWLGWKTKQLLMEAQPLPEPEAYTPPIDDTPAEETTMTDTPIISRHDEPTDPEHGGRKLRKRGEGGRVLPNISDGAGDHAPTP